MALLLQRYSKNNSKYKCDEKSSCQKWQEDFFVRVDKKLKNILYPMFIKHDWRKYV